MNCCLSIQYLSFHHYKKNWTILLCCIKCSVVDDIILNDLLMWNGFVCTYKNEALFLFQDLDVGARHIKLYLNSTLVFEGELGKGCGNQVFDYSTTIDLKDFQLLDSLFSSPVSSRHNLGSASSQCIETKNGVDVGSPHLSNLQSLESTGQTMMDMEERSRTLLPPIISSPGAVSSSTRRSSMQRNSFDLITSEEPLSLRQQVEQFAPLEQTVTTQPSSRVAPQWLQPLNRGVPEGCEASREKPRWLVPQNSAEPKSSVSSASMLPDLPCNPGRVCRGVDKSVNGGPWKANSLDLGCDLLEDLKGEPKSDRPISGRRSSFRNAAVTSRPSEEQHLRTAALSNAGRINGQLMTHFHVIAL